jgi:hypothetical protein
VITGMIVRSSAVGVTVHREVSGDHASFFKWSSTKCKHKAIPKMFFGMAFIYVKIWASTIIGH